jgi:hypothetical protein
VFLRLSRVVVIFAAVQILGGHWVALQTAAWIGMVANFAQSNSLGVAIEKTFDGEHPCGLCAVVKKGQAEEQKEEAVKAVLKMEAVLATVAVAPAPRMARWNFPPLTGLMTARALAPPTPPPLVA